MASHLQAGLLDNHWDEDIEDQHGDSQTALLTHHLDSFSDGSPVASRRNPSDNPPVNPIARVWSYTHAKLKNLWSPSLDVRKVTWIPEQFWVVPPSVVGGDGLLEDIRNGVVPPREGFQKVDPRTLDGETLIRCLQTRHQVADELNRQYRKQHRRQLLAMAIGSVLLLAALGSLVSTSSAATAACKADGSCNDISRIWAQYSPEFSVPSAIDPDTPQGCTTNFALVLSRHGARYPTAKKSKVYNSTIVRIQSDVTKYGKGYGWLKDYVYELGSDDLTEFGQEELVDSGKAFYKRYKKLAEKSEPFIRSSGSDRVVMSSYNFTQGYYGAQGRSAADKIDDILIISEDAGVNNTMSHSLCEAFEDGWASEYGDDATAAWQDVFVPAITKRLNKNLPGANLTDDEAIYLMDLCPFNTVNTSGAKSKSKFCNLFTRAEWRSYNYLGTLDKYYGYGNGNPLGPTQGVGYVNELIARLTRKHVVDHTSTNRTLDSSPKTFPLNRALYADFSHDNDMTTIFSALGLYNETSTLPTTKIVEATQAHGFSAAWAVPFAARMYVEKMECRVDRKTDEYVRILINDRVMPLKTCGGDEHGRCKLDKFVKSLSFARSGGRWSECAV